MSDIKNHRRKFLGGSAAVPFIMTVHPGSVLAKSSTAAACATLDQNQNTPPTAGETKSTGSWAPDADIWYRKQVDLYTLVVNGQAKTGYYILPWSGRSQNYYWKVSTDPASTTAPLMTTWVPGATNVRATKYGTRQALCQVDKNNGALIGFQWESGLGGQKITKSCLASFK